MATFYKLMGVASDGFDPEQRFVTSWLLPPSLLAAYRLLFALFDWATIITIFIWDGINDPDEIARDFSYFTALTWWGLTTYLTISGLHTLVYSSKGYSWLHRSWPRPLQVLHSLFYTTIVVFPFIVTIVYWAILYDGPWFSVKMSAFANVSSTTTQMFLLTLVGIEARLELVSCTSRDNPSGYEPSTLATCPLPHCSVGNVLGSCLRDTCNTRLLCLQLLEPGAWGWSTCRIHCWNCGCVCRDLPARSEPCLG